MQDRSVAQGEAQEKRPSPVDRLAERFSVAGRAATVFGEPVEREGVTVIPVARVRWGLGGGWGSGQGEGSDGKGTGEGGGGGGGLSADPVGYIEISAAGTRYRPVIDPVMMLRTALIGGLLALLITRWRRG